MLVFNLPIIFTQGDVPERPIAVPVKTSVRASITAASVVEAYAAPVRAERARKAKQIRNPEALVLNARQSLKRKPMQPHSEQQWQLLAAWGLNGFS
jgi:hypothetical protein